MFIVSKIRPRKLTSVKRLLCFMGTDPRPSLLSTKGRIPLDTRRGWLLRFGSFFSSRSTLVSTSCLWALLGWGSVKACCLEGICESFEETSPHEVLTYSPLTEVNISALAVTEDARPRWWNPSKLFPLAVNAPARGCHDSDPHSGLLPGAHFCSSKLQIRL